MSLSSLVIDKGTNSAHGYYQVGTRTFSNKSDALIEATQTGLEPRWIFHEDVFKKLNWQVRPAESLTELYRQRAQQIRDSYDYVIVQFSGGGDSWTVLDSFLRNGIHVDEVFTRFPVKGARRYKQADNTDFSPENLTSEYEFAAKPVLEHIEKHFPQTHITMYDFTDDLTGELTEDEFRASNVYLNVGSYKRSTARSEHEIAARNAGKSVGVVFGIDKIFCTKNGNDFNVSFWDLATLFADVDPARSIEYFYWTPDLPQVMIAQAHAVFDYFRSHPEHHWLIDDSIKYREHSRIYNQIVKDICYPNYPRNTFQVGKQTSSMHFYQGDSWIVKAGYNESFVQSWLWTLKQYTKLIDDRFFDRNPGSNIKTGYKVLKSPVYKIGEFLNLD